MLQDLNLMIRSVQDIERLVTEDFIGKVIDDLNGIVFINVNHRDHFHNDIPVPTNSVRKN